MWSRLYNPLKPREDLQDSPTPDPFGADATTYYTQPAPPTPPRGSHSRTASREEDLIWSLRTQLALQQEMCAQFEVDLNARDELVQALTTRLDTSEKENEKRKSVVRSWRKKAAELEKLCRHLEEEVEHGHQESMERSMMDEASGAALRQLHHRISQLEREKRDVQAERDTLAGAMEKAEGDLVRLRRELADKDGLLEREKRHVQSERDAWAQKAEEDARLLREDMADLESRVQSERDALVSAAVAKAEEDARQLREEHDLVRRAIQSERDAAHEDVRQLREANDVLARERDSLVQAVEDARLLRIQLESKAGADAEMEQTKRKIAVERDEMSRLQAYIQQLQRDNATKEVTVVQLNKQLDQGKDDIDGLNIALESKQQELELIKRKHGIRTAMALSQQKTATKPVGVLRRTSNSTGEFKTRLASRRLSLATSSDEKENMAVKQRKV